MIKIRLVGDKLELRFPYNPKIVNMMKEIPSHSWDPEKKCWSFPKVYLKEIERKFPQLEWESDRSKVNDQLKTWDETDIDVEISESFKIEPFNYQLIGGYAFLPTVKTALLGDEVGIGKSFQALIGFQRLYNEGKVKKMMVICKKSLILQWASEIEKFTNLTPLPMIGSPEKRKELYIEARKPEYQIILINYELLTRDFIAELKEGCKKKKEILWDPISDLITECIDILCLDEAQKIKNYRNQLSERIRAIRNLTPYKWLLTGTPVENSPEDIFNLFYFMNDKVFGTNPIPFRSRYLMLDRYRKPCGTKNLEELHERISPYFLRRTHKDVEQEFPEVKIDEILLEMTDTQTKLDKQIRDKIDDILKGNYDEDDFFDYDDDDFDKEEKQDSALGIFSLLMQVTNCPSLLLSSDSKFAHKIASDYKLAQLSDSPKYDWILEFIQDRLENNPDAKTMIFSKYERVVRQVSDLLTSKRISNVVYTGGMGIYQRDDAMKAFWDKTSVIIGSDAMSTGLNAQIADVIINIDLPWNPALFTQRRGRITRAGSKFKNVTVINLTCEDSIDQRIKEVFYEKQGISDKIVEGTSADKAKIQRITANVLKKLASKGRRRKNAI